MISVTVFSVAWGPRVVVSPVQCHVAMGMYQPNAVLFGDSLRTGVRQISGLLFPDPASRLSRLVCQVHSGAN